MKEPEVIICVGFGTDHKQIKSFNLPRHGREAD